MPETNRKIAALLTEGFEQVEFTSPRDALRQAGYTVHIVAPKEGQVKAMQGKSWGDTFDVDVLLERADPADYDALLLPGGVVNSDHLRVSRQAQHFARAVFDAARPIAVICHAPWILTEIDVLRGRTVTSYPTLRTDLENAGATWVDHEVVEDGPFIFSRNPDDLPAFNAAFLRALERQSQKA